MYFDTVAVANFAELVSKYSEGEFASPYRSTIPLLSLVKDQCALLRKILTEFDVPDRASLHFEFKVDPIRGRGKPSHTDLMVRSEQRALAIEAKWTERPYDTVAVWIRKGATPTHRRDATPVGHEAARNNRREVLAGWIDQLQRFAARELDPQDFTGVTYQMIHRAASACYDASNPQLTYLHFVDAHDRKRDSIDYCRRQLQHLHALLGHSSQFPISLVTIVLTPTGNFRTIEGLPRGKPATAGLVRDALLNTTLFEFGEYEIEKIRKDRNDGAHRVNDKPRSPSRVEQVVSMKASELFDLSGRVGLVTGASSGLGLRFAEVLAANGAAVALVARRKERLAALQARIEAAGGRAVAIEADVLDGAAMRRAFDAAEAAFGTVTILVNNAGVGHSTRALDLPEEEWRRVLGTNLDAVFFWSQEGARRMLAAGQPGAIINIASVLGFGVGKGVIAYAAAKAGVVQITKALGLELAFKGIRVNAIAPGWFVTEINRDYLASDAGKKLTRDIPVGRFGRDGDLDGALLLLASDAGRFIAGATIVVDGGQMVALKG
jgi:3-oxoacyl-[acyl-carrier protein] reductase